MSSEIENSQSVLELELETLSSIYVDELDVKHDELGTSTVSILLYPATADKLEEQYVRMNLTLSLPEKYPDVIPEIVIQNARGLSDEKIDEIIHNLMDIAETRIGSFMLFELIQSAKEQLTAQNIPNEECAICLYGFMDGDIFMRTECYHYFHSNCLSRYMEYKLAVEDEEEEEEDKSAKEAEKDESPIKKVPCPVCRLKVHFSEFGQEFPKPIAMIEAPVVDSCAWEGLSAFKHLYQKQLAQGGIIDIEAENNKFKLDISSVPDKPEVSNKLMEIPDPQVMEPEIGKKGPPPTEGAKNRNSPPKSRPLRTKQNEENTRFSRGAYNGDKPKVPFHRNARYSDSKFRPRYPNSVKSRMDKFIRKDDLPKEVQGPDAADGAKEADESRATDCKIDSKNTLQNDEQTLDNGPDSNKFQHNDNKNSGNWGRYDSRRNYDRPYNNRYNSNRGNYNHLNRGNYNSSNRGNYHNSRGGGGYHRNHNTNLYQRQDFSDHSSAHRMRNQENTNSPSTHNRNYSHNKRNSSDSPRQDSLKENDEHSSEVKSDKKNRSYMKEKNSNQAVESADSSLNLENQTVSDESKNSPSNSEVVNKTETEKLRDTEHRNSENVRSSGRDGENLRSSEPKHAENSRGPEQKHIENSRGPEQKHIENSRGPEQKHGENSRSPEQKHDENSRGPDQKQGENSKDPEQKHDEYSRGPEQKHGEYSRGAEQKHGEYSRGPEQKHGEYSRGPEQKHGDYSRGPYQRNGENPRGPDRRYAEHSRGFHQRNDENYKKFDQRTGENSRGFDSRNGGNSRGFVPRHGGNSRGFGQKYRGNFRGFDQWHNENPRRFNHQNGENSRGFEQRSSEHSRGFNYRNDENSRGLNHRNGEYSRGFEYRNNEHSRGYTQRNDGNPSGYSQRSENYRGYDQRNENSKAFDERNSQSSRGFEQRHEENPGRFDKGQEDHSKGNDTKYEQSSGRFDKAHEGYSRGFDRRRGDYSRDFDRASKDNHQFKDRSSRYQDQPNYHKNDIPKKFHNSDSRSNRNDKESSPSQILQENSHPDNRNRWQNRDAEEPNKRNGAPAKYSSSHSRQPNPALEEPDKKVSTSSVKKSPELEKHREKNGFPEQHLSSETREFQDETIKEKTKARKSNRESEESHNSSDAPATIKEPPGLKKHARNELSGNFYDGPPQQKAEHETLYRVENHSRTKKHSNDLKSLAASNLMSAAPLSLPPGFANPSKKVIYGLPSFHTPPGFNLS